MKKCILFFGLIWSTIAFGQNSVFEEIIQDYYQQLFVEHQIDKISEFMSEDALVLNDGETYDLNEMRTLLINLKEQFESAKENGKNLTRSHQFQFLHFKQHSEKTWLVYENQAEFYMDGIVIAQLKWLESAVFVPKNEAWGIELMHISSIKENK